MFEPSKKVLIEADLFFDLYTLVEMASHGKFDDLMEIELDATELLPKMQEKLKAMIARKAYAERKKEKESL